MGTHSRRRLTADERARLEAANPQRELLSIAQAAADKAVAEYSVRLEQCRRDELSRTLNGLRRRYGMDNPGQ